MDRHHGEITLRGGQVMLLFNVENWLPVHDYVEVFLRPPSLTSLPADYDSLPTSTPDGSPLLCIECLIFAI